MKKFKYAIFDMDGTLLDSMGEWRNLGRNYLIGKGIDVPDNLNEIINSMTAAEAALYFKREFKIEKSLEEILTAIKSMIEDKYKYEFKMKPYVKEYLYKLKQERVNMCIATATPYYMAEFALKRLDILKLFSFVVCCDDVGVGKTKPDIYYYAADKLNAAPEEIVVYEDADYALKTAKEAGFFTVGVYDEHFNKNIREIKVICDKYVKSFKELI